MNAAQLERMRHGKGFIAALDQSGGSTPKALAAYGVPEGSWKNETEMFDLVHAMRTRIVISPSFDGRRVLGAILFEQTMDRQVRDQYTADYLWNEKQVVPFLKVDKGLAALEDGVQLMKPIDGLDDLLARAASRHVFGTKMRSVVKAASASGIEAVVAQQFEIARQIASVGMVPIVEPEVDIHIADKAEAERLLRDELLRRLDELPEECLVMLKLSIPSEVDFFAPLMAHSRVVRVVALSGGYDQKKACDLLALNHGLIASFSRALAEGLSAGQSDGQFDATLEESVARIYRASIV